MDHDKDPCPAFSPWCFPMELHQKEVLTEDMGSWWSALMLSRGHGSDPLQGQNGPELLVAQADADVGDPSGGPVLKKVARWALQLPSTGEGTQSYLFEHIDSAKGFRQLCQARMNALDLNLNTRERIMEEAKGLCELHQPGSALAPGHEGKGDEQNLPSVLLNSQRCPGAHSCAEQAQPPVLSGCWCGPG